MYIPKINRYHKLALLIAGLSTALFAAFIDFDPASQPAVTLAPFELKEYDLTKGNTKAYRPWFENGTWQGDVIEYDIVDGAKSTDVTVGETDNTVLLAYANQADYGTDKNWSARATFLANEQASSTYWQTRNIITYNSDQVDFQVDFLWSELSDTQKEALDSAAYDPDGDGDTSDMLLESTMLNFLHGDKSNEKGQDGSYRIRFSLLGDIINSKPVYLGQPRESYTHDGFLTYKIDQKDRAGRVFVGANDGLLHVFDATDGSEVYAYLPSMLIVDPDDASKLSKLRNLATIPYNHTYYVDGQLTVASAQIDGTWKSVLASGLGHGEKGLFVLDVTDPDFPGTGNKVLFEKTGNDIGHIYGQPGIVMLPDGNWYIVTGNGFGSITNEPMLLVISLANGTMTTITAGGASGGLSAPVLIDSATPGVADLAYAGDSNGHLWRFDLSNFTAGDASSVVVSQLFQGVATQPITSMPEIGREPICGHMIFFGTGSAHSLPETLDDTRQQAIYGLCEHLIDLDLDLDSNDIPTIIDLDEKVLTQAVNDTARYVSTTNAATAPAKGWYAPFPTEDMANNNCDPTDGERLLGRPALRAGRLTFVTTNPGGLTPDQTCATGLEGNSWLMSFDYRTGTDAGLVALDLNGDGFLRYDGTDNIDADTIPVGIKLGPGNISQPTIANLGGDIDVMFINGLLLTIPEYLPPGPFLNGHIDVQTDSPEGGWGAPNEVIDMSEGYDVQTNDGLGRAVDGHVHAYDTIHGVSYVDLFRLEPRRGLARLDATLTPTVGDACPTGSETVPGEDANGDPVVLGCLDIVEAELNRAYDTRSDAADCTGCPESEVKQFNTETGLVVDHLVPTQKFMVVLANADLSPGASLQIGCRVWNGGTNEDGINEFIQYQDHIAARLEAGDDPGEITDLKYGEPVVYTLAGIAAADPADCPQTNPPTPPSLRIGFNQRSILDGGILGTRAQCVLGLHDYREPVCYTDKITLEEASSNGVVIDTDGSVTALTCSTGIPSTPPDGYIKDPGLNLHITKTLDTGFDGYRWRNGALTLQLLAVNNDESETAAFSLQDKGTLVRKTTGNRVERRGGTFAKAFTVTKVTGKDVITADNTTKGLENESGLLYETTVYWHYSDLADELRRGDPASIPCYGDSNYGSALSQELGGLTQGEYQGLIEGIEDLIMGDYKNALNELEAALLSGDENRINQALLDLGTLLEDNPELAEYHRFRDYAPGHVPPQHLLPIDNPPGGGDDSDPDAPVVPGITTDLDDLPGPAAGIDDIEQQRSWIDLTP